MKLKVLTLSLLVLFMSSCYGLGSGTQVAGTIIGADLGGHIGSMVGRRNGGFGGDVFGTILGTVAGAAIGNAVVDYLLYERPESESDYIFLTTSSPHYPLKTHSGCRIILKKVLEKADINIGNRPSGTRLTRHSRATFLLNRGIPLATIAQSLGHSNELSVQIYLTTDRKKMAECILPLPGRKVVSNES